MSGNVTGPKVKIQAVGVVIPPSDPRHSKHEEWKAKQKALAEKKEATDGVHDQ